MAASAIAIAQSHPQSRDFAQGKQPEIHFLEPTRSTDSLAPDEGQDFKPRPRSASHHLAAVKPPSRKWLLTQARTWRFLMGIGMHLHDLRGGNPPKPSFVHSIPNLPRGSQHTKLYFYNPPDYLKQTDVGHKYPIVVNFHGGGFCLGTPLDDRYWARSIIKDVPCVFVSVGYRLAPEHSFPTAVDDSVDALLYLSANAEALGLDTTRITLSGFSAGANLAFTVPLLL